MSTLEALIARAASRYVPGFSCRIRQRTSGPYARAVPGSSMATATTRTVGSALFTAAERSALNVAMPHLRGMDEATNAIRITPSSQLSARWAGRSPSRAVAPGEGLTWGTLVNSVPAARRRSLFDGQSRVSPRGETTADIHGCEAAAVEDARGEAGSHSGGAIGNEGTVAWQFTDPTGKLFVGNVARAGSVTFHEFGRLAHVQEHGSMREP